MIVEIILGLVIAITLIFMFNRHPPGMPPGPYKFPIFGSGAPSSEQNCMAYKEKYGDIFTTQFGKSYTVTLCNYKLVKEVLSKVETSFRPRVKVIEEHTHGPLKGLLFSNGAQWVSTRRFTLRQLRDLGMGKSFLEESIQREAKDLTKSFEKFTQLPSTDLPMSLKYAVLNIVWQMIAGKRYEYENEAITKLDNLKKNFMKKSKLIFAYDFFPILRVIFPGRLGKFLFNLKEINFFEEIRKEVKPFIQEHRENKDLHDSNDFISQYLVQMDDPSNNKGLFSEEDLYECLIDLFNAGADTVTNTLRWALIFMAKYPEVQKKVQQEIDDKIDRDHQPGFNDKQKLPYTEAMIHEVLRKSSLINFSVVREANESMQVGEYVIPKGTRIQPAAFSIHNDARYWKNPKEFNPERFLDEDGCFNFPKEGFLPFGIGRRHCIGENLAKTELFIFLSCLLQKFSFAAAPGKEIDMGTENYMSVRWPKPQELKITLRK